MTGFATGSAVWMGGFSHADTEEFCASVDEVEVDANSVVGVERQDEDDFGCFGVHDVVVDDFEDVSVRGVRFEAGEWGIGGGGLNFPRGVSLGSGAGGDSLFVGIHGNLETETFSRGEFDFQQSSTCVFTGSGSDSVDVASFKVLEEVGNVGFVATVGFKSERL